MKPQRILSFLTALIVSSSFVPVNNSVYAEDTATEITVETDEDSDSELSENDDVKDGVYNGMTYLHNGKKVVINGYTDEIGADVTIPARIDGMPVTNISEGAFEYCNFESVTIEEGITKIPKDCFSSCNYLKSITIPDSVTSIGDSAFFYCTSLTEVTIPDSVTSIGYNAFWGCYSLTDVAISAGIAEIKSGTFGDCDALTSFIIPENVTEIRSSAFNDCNLLNEIIIMNSEATIEEGAFDNCGSRLVIYGFSDSTAETYANEHGIHFLEIGMKMKTTDNGIMYFENTDGGITVFSYIGEETVVDIPREIDGKSVTKIDAKAFYNCSSLTEITIPEGVTTIGNYAFYDCNSLTEITIPDSVTTIGDYAFYNCNLLTEITIPEGVTTIGNYAFSDCYSLTEIIIPDSVTSIKSGAFQGCTALTKITIPDSVTTIGDGAFSCCYSLTEIAIPDSVTTIGTYAFEHCIELTKITIPDSVTSIGYYAFVYCKRTLTIYGVKESTAENYAEENSIIFAEIGGKPEVRITDDGIIYTLDNNDEVLIWGYEGESSVVNIPQKIENKSVRKIIKNAFKGSVITEITLPDSLTTIGNSAFYDCDSLTEITIPDSVTTIEDYAFCDCNLLTNITRH